MCKAFRGFCLALAAIALAGCFPPTTTHPIGPSVGLKPDLSLAGLWRAKMADADEARPVYFHFTPRLDGTMTVVMVQGGSQPDGDWMTASATAGAAGANHYLSATMRFSEKGEDTKDASRGTIPLLYRIEAPGRISLFILDETAAKAAIQAGKIAGSVEPGAAGDAKITADPAALDKFFSSTEGAALFSKRFATLIKVD